jgi:hypothetical protein
MLNRLHHLPLSQEHKKQEMNTIFQIAQHNGYPITQIERLNNQIVNKSKEKNTTNKTQSQNTKKMDSI